MEHILKSYQRRLINLSANNRALVLRRLNAGLQLDLQAFDFINNHPAFELLRELIAGKKSVLLAPFADPRQADVAPLSRRLREISRRANLLQEERGTKELFVGWPFVSGKLNDGTAIRCPLLFFPVSLELNGKQQWVLTQDKGVSPVLNKSFLLAYAHYNQLLPDENLLAFDVSELSNDALAFRTALYELLKNSNLQINFNQELFQDKIVPVRSFTKPEFEAQFRPGELKLFPEAVLGIFPQAGSYLMADYDEMLQQPDLNSFSDLFKTNAETASTSRNLEQNTFAIFDLDAPQETVLQEVKKGHSVVVQGPPGTGKSQLICNLVTDFLARGKTVWVVCQKRAALDVVYNRLASKGLGNFAGLVHDVEADHRKIFEKLRLQIEEVETYKKQNNQLPVVFAERQFLETSRRINQILQTFTEFKTALFDASVCGWPVKELYLSSSLKGSSIELGEIYPSFTAATLPFFLPKAEAFLRAAAQLDAPNFPLADRKSFAGWNWTERRKLEQLALEIPIVLGAFRNELPEQIVQQHSNLSAWKLLQPEAPNLQRLADLLRQNEASFSVFQALFSKASAELEQVLKTVKRLEKFYAETAVALNPEALRKAEIALTTFAESRKSVWQKTKWQFNSEARQILEKTLQQFELPHSESGIQNLRKQLEIQREIQERLAWLQEIVVEPTDSLLTKAEAREGYFISLKDAIAAAQIAKKLVRKKWLLADPETVLLQVKKLLNALEVLDNATKNWQEYLTENQVEKLAENESFRTEFLQTIDQHFDEIAAHDSRFEAFSETEKTVIKTLQNLPGTVNQKLKAFQNSVFLNWITHLENQFSVLKLAGPELNKLETELQELVQQKQQLSYEIVLTRLRENTYASLEKNRLGNTVSYRKLYAQVSKKRSLYPLRKLQALFGEEIAGLMPCWLASPETISALFPLNQTADLIIFDEASQAFAETGLPAIFRAKQVVIAGDEHQLAPTDLYRSRWQDEDTETEELFVESLLQLGSLHLPQHWLTQHYRSRFPELIHFSNQHFYRNKLQLIPDRQDIETRVPAIEFRKVNGIWENQTNRREAEEVVNLLFNLLSGGQTDIGIITFNFAQQSLIQDLAEAEAANRKIVVPETVLIKNIENMQGDEKQVIIFSIGYAPDATGKVLNQFGSLSQAKGENRLNVAITRAISKTYVVCSLEPEELNVENTRHEGPKMLQAFLRFARQVSSGNYTWQVPESASANHPLYLKDLLLPAGKTVAEISKKLPFADLTLVRNERFCHLFRTDDDLYFSQISARQTHYDVPFLLQKRNWPYSTFYSRQFWLHAEKVLQKISQTQC